MKSKIDNSNTYAQSVQVDGLCKASLLSGLAAVTAAYPRPPGQK